MAAWVRVDEARRHGGRLMTRRRLSIVVLGWALLYSRNGNEWRSQGWFAYEGYCERVLEARVRDETFVEIGGALAVQSPDNPMRQDAYRHAEPRVRERYRCDKER
jgi:hypothetical protein